MTLAIIIGLLLVAFALLVFLAQVRHSMEQHARIAHVKVRCQNRQRVLKSRYKYYRW